jgi:hypothetical protein
MAGSISDTGAASMRQRHFSARGKKQNRRAASDWRVGDLQVPQTRCLVSVCCPMRGWLLRHACIQSTSVAVETLRNIHSRGIDVGKQKVNSVRLYRSRLASRDGKLATLPRHAVSVAIQRKGSGPAAFYLAHLFASFPVPIDGLFARRAFACLSVSVERA